MPLLKGKTEIGHNIKEMQKAGHPHDQSVAASLRTAGVPPKKNAEHDDWKLIKNVEAFSVGEKRGRKYTPQDLKDIVENFHKYGKGQRPGFDVPAVLGHEESSEGQLKFLENTGIPAAGWIRDARQDGKKLYLDLEASPPLHKAIRSGHYGPVSIEIYDKPPEGLPGAKGKMMRRLAMLGGEIPQDKNLARMSAYSERLFRTHLKDCIQFRGRDYVTCFSEVHMMPSTGMASTGPSHEEMVAKLAEHGFDPEAMKTHEGCMAEMLRMAETMKPGGAEKPGGIGDLDFDHEPEGPQDEDEHRQYGETAAKMQAYVEKMREKMKKFAEKSLSGTVNGDPLPKVSSVHPGPSGSEKSGLGGPSENQSKHTAMSEQIRNIIREEVGILRAEFKPIKDRAEEDEQLAVFSFCEQEVAKGHLTAAQIDRKSPLNVVDELLGLDNASVIAKFSENGRTVPLTARKRRMKQISTGPVVWKNSEIANNGVGGTQRGEQAPDQAVGKIERFCEDHFLGDDIKQSLVEGWENMKKAKGRAADVNELLNV